ncbi:CAP-Gly domain-containing linker protein 1-like [Stegodyphus dumicola]|uniref:CAP-Gly domain-containing linker protein 1-like n=1 Tax=Stegodyphus dumicola TaxID=202533 RepID=UPI0015B2BCFB|nr:CAP-Gly domain-containing linker protein 1-like [Stegodyphus dumicola]
MEEFKLGERVKILGKNNKGVVAFIGNTEFSEGIWAGIILDEPKGKNNGGMNGIQYFQCPPKRGIFVRPYHLRKECADTFNSNDKCTSRSVYPNYLKSSSKLKLEKHKCQSIIIDPNAVALKSKSLTKQCDLQCQELQNLKSLLSDKDLEARKLKEEKGILEEKLRSCEKKLEEISEKHSEALEETENLKTELQNKAKENSVMGKHLELLKARNRWLEKCNNFREEGIQVEVNTSADKQSNLEKKFKIMDGSIASTEDEAIFAEDQFNTVKEQNQLSTKNVQALQNVLQTKVRIESNKAEANTKDSNKKYRYKTKAEIPSTTLMNDKESGDMKQGTLVKLEKGNYLEKASEIGNEILGSSGRPEMKLMVKNNNIEALNKVNTCEAQNLYSNFNQNRTTASNFASIFTMPENVFPAKYNSDISDYTPSSPKTNCMEICGEKLDSKAVAIKRSVNQSNSPTYASKELLDLTNTQKMNQKNEKCYDALRVLKDLITSFEARNNQKEFRAITTKGTALQQHSIKAIQSSKSDSRAEAADSKNIDSNTLDIRRQADKNKLLINKNKKKSHCKVFYSNHRSQYRK